MYTVVIVLLSIAGLTTSQTQWTHHDESTWPGQCTVGSQQSPIDIVSSQSRPDPKGHHIRGRLVFSGYDAVNVTARNTGYTLRWGLIPNTPAPMLSGGPLRGNYTFADVHFHWLSEHTFEGLKYPLEIHLVHIKSGLTLAEAVKQPDGIAVVGVVADVGTPESSTVLDDLMPAMPLILERSGDTAPFTINLTSLLSPHPQQYYTYHGSLTTPTCAEAVTWIVMPKPTLVSHENYKILTQARFSGIHNDRSVQPLGKRIMYRSKELASCSNIISPSNFGSFAVLLSCITSNMSSKIYKGLCGFGNFKRRLFGKEIKQCD